MKLSKFPDFWSSSHIWICRDRSCCERIVQAAEDFKEFVASTCCTCLTNVPSLALIICALVLIALLLATIPLVFAMTYQRPQSQMSEEAGDIFGLGETEMGTISLDDRHGDLTEEVMHSNSLIPENVTSCPGFGFACTNYPVSWKRKDLDLISFRELPLERTKDVMDTQTALMDLTNWAVTNVKQLSPVQPRKTPRG